MSENGFISRHRSFQDVNPLRPIGGPHVIYEIIRTDCREMLLGAFDFALFRRTDVDVVVAATFGFRHEVHAMLAIDFFDVRPIRVVRAQRGIYLETARKLREDF